MKPKSTFHTSKSVLVIIGIPLLFIGSLKIHPASTLFIAYLVTAALYFFCKNRFKDKVSSTRHKQIAESQTFSIVLIFMLLMVFSFKLNLFKEVPFYQSMIISLIAYFVSYPLGILLSFLKFNEASSQANQN